MLEEVEVGRKEREWGGDEEMDDDDGEGKKADVAVQPVPAPAPAEEVDEML